MTSLEWERPQDDTTWSKCRTYEIVRSISRDAGYRVYLRRKNGSPCSLLLSTSMLRLKEAKGLCLGHVRRTQ